MLEVSETEKSVVALQLPNGPLKPALGWSRYRDANPVPTNPLADATAPSRPVKEGTNVY